MDELCVGMDGREFFLLRRTRLRNRYRFLCRLVAASHAGTCDGGCCSGGAAAARVERVGDSMEAVELLLLICRPARHSIRAVVP